MAATLEGVASDVSHIKETLDRLEGLVATQNGRQRKNTETIIRLCAKMDAAEDDIDVHEKAISKNVSAIHEAEVKSARGDRLIAMMTALVGGGGAAAYLVFGR